MFVKKSQKMKSRRATMSPEISDESNTRHRFNRIMGVIWERLYNAMLKTSTNSYEYKELARAAKDSIKLSDRYERKELSPRESFVSLRGLERTARKIDSRLQKLGFLHPVVDSRGFHSREYKYDEEKVKKRIRERFSQKSQKKIQAFKTPVPECKTKISNSELHIKQSTLPSSTEPKKLQISDFRERLSNARLRLSVKQFFRHNQLHKQVKQKVKESSKKSIHKELNSVEHMKKLCPFDKSSHHFADTDFLSTPQKFRRPTSAIEVGSSPQKSIFLSKKSRGLQRKINKILETCSREQDETENATSVANILHNQLCDNYQSLQLMLDRRRIEDQKEKNIYVKNIVQKKHLFLYGQNGEGRYLTDNGVDALKISDDLVNLNPKYRFLYPKLHRLYDSLINIAK